MDTQVETLESILAAPAEEPVKETVTSTAPATEIDETPAEMVWDEDDESTPAPDEDVEVAPEDADDEELAKIEEKNEWMKKRLAPTKEKLSKAEQEIQKLRQELEAVKAGKPVEAPPEAQQQAPAASVEEYVASVIANDPITTKLQKEFADLENKEGVTNGELVRAAAKLEARKEILEANVKSYIASQQQEIAKSEKAIENDYTKAVLAKKEIYPDIDKSLARVNKNAANLNIDIRRALVFDGESNKINELAPDLVNIIGNDKKALGYLIAQSKLAAKTGRTPVAALEYIGRLKESIKNSASSKAPDEEAPVVHKAPGLPKSLKAVSSPEPSNLYAWAKDAVKAGKQPW